MIYDMVYGMQYFNLNLYDFSYWLMVVVVDKYSVDFVVNNYLVVGFKFSQMNFGIGFYGWVLKWVVELGIDWMKVDV